MQTLVTPHPSASLACNWWAFALRGVIAIAFGGLAVMLPVATVLLVTLVFGSYALVDGALTLASGLRRPRQGRRWGWLVVSGLLGIAAGIMVWIWPPAASLGLSAFIWSVVAGWYLVAGALELATAVHLRRMLQGEWLLGLRGALSVLLGLALLLLMWRHPLASLVGLGWMVGLASLLSGLTLLALSWRLLRLLRSLRTSP